MTEELYNKLSLYKDSIMCLRYNSLENTSIEEIRNLFDKSINNIKSILNNIQNEKNIDIFINIITEIKSELRREIIKECQEKATVMNQYGVQYIETEDYNPIIIKNYLIELCEDMIKDIQNPEKEAEEIEIPNKNIIYIYSSKLPKSEDDSKSMKLIREDLESIPPVYYESFLKVIEDMHSGTYIGKEHKCKVLSNDKLEGMIEHRAYHGVRLYENSIKTYNNKTARIIKKLENELGAEIHFVFKLEIKKCKKTNGLDEEREKRYKNEKENYEALIKTLTKEDVQNLADITYNLIKKYLSDKKKKQTEKEAEKEITLYNVLDIISFYTHKDYSLDSTAEFELTGERAIENEKYQIFKRIIKYLDTKELEELKELSKIFNIIDEITCESNNTYSTEKEKQIKAEKEKNKIISMLICLLGEMELDELKEVEIEIIMLMDYKDEYEISSNTKEEENEYGR